MTWLYRHSEPNLWTVGFYGPDGWEPESDHPTKQAAAERVAFLNGGRCPERPTSVITVRLTAALHDALKTEAHERNISLNRLCVMKLRGESNTGA